MDTLTHALSGVLLARVARQPGASLAQGRREWACGLGAAFPDVDFVLMALVPSVFLNLHRGPTHSLVLLPLWAALLALALAWLWRGDAHGRWWRRLMPLMPLCALGVVVHIAGDWVTIYGTRLFYPLDTTAYALAWSWDVNVWIAALLLAGALVGWRRQERAAWAARAALLAAGAALLAQGGLRQQALALARPQSAHATATGAWALPQPLSPFHWHLVLADGDGYRTAFIDLLAGAPGASITGYRTRGDLIWRVRPGPGSSASSRTIWSLPELAAYRAFAVLPVVYRIDDDARGTCVWFADLRHALPWGPPPFRQGVCRASAEAPWRLYRLRYFSEDARQAI